MISILLVGLVVTKTVIMVEPWSRLVSWFSARTGLTEYTSANILFAGLTFAYPVTLVLLAALSTKVLAGLKNRRTLDIVRVWGYTTAPVAIFAGLAVAVRAAYPLAFSHAKLKNAHSPTGAG